MLCLPQRFRIENHRGQVEFFLELHSPLLADRCWTHHKDFALALSPVLTYDQPRFDGFAKPYFVGEYHALGERRAQCKECCLDLVRVEVDLGIEKRHRQAVKPFGCMAGQIPGKVFGMIRCDGEHQEESWI